MGQCGKQFVFDYFVFACNMHTQWVASWLLGWLLVTSMSTRTTMLTTMQQTDTRRDIRVAARACTWRGGAGRCASTNYSATLVQCNDK